MGLKIGIIGVGGLGYLQAETYQEMEGVSIVAAADVTTEARELFEREFQAPAYKTYQALIENHGSELDAVTIVTPHTLHYDQTTAALTAGLHVLVEKPMVTDVGHAVDIVERAAEQDLVVQVGYQRRFHPAFREMRRIIRDGRLGDLHTVSCFIEQNWIQNHRGSWRVNPSLSGGGQLYDTGSHLLDALLWLTGGIPQSVSADIEFDAPEVDVNSVLTIRLDCDGQDVLASVAICGDGRTVTPGEGYFLWGSEGQLAYTADELVVTEHTGITYRTEITSDYDFGVLNERKLENFIGSIEGHTQPAVPASDGLHVTALTESAYRAADTGGEVPVQSLVDEYRTD